MSYGIKEDRNTDDVTIADAQPNGAITVINHGNHDSIILANVPVTDLHASNFIIHAPLRG